MACAQSRASHHQGHAVRRGNLRDILAVSIVKTRDAEGHPVEVMIAVIAGDMVSFDYDFPVPN
jgi:hypothetical protein